MARATRRLALASLALAMLPAALPAASPAHADDAAPSPYGATYTAAELAALDRALHAGNCTRVDLTFKKEMAKGIGALPVVSGMLRDPLRIAPTMDAIAQAADGKGREGLDAALATAVVLYGEADPLVDRYATAVREARRRLAVPPAPFTPSTPAQALVALEAVLAKQPTIDATLGDTEAERLVSALALRQELPEAMAWHPVGTTPFPDRKEALETFVKGKPQPYLHELASKLDVPALARAWSEAFAPLLATVASWPKEAFPTDAPIVRQTPFGRIAIGTTGDETYTGNYAAIVDPGGNDRYERGRFASSYGVDDQRVGLLVDLGGDDTYDCGDTDDTLGAAILGIAALVDLGAGNDRYAGGHASLGAAIGGVAVLYDDGGSDTYAGKAFTEGAAGFGIGILLDDAVQAPPVVKTDEETKDPIAIAAFDDDRLHAWVNAQGFARPKGVALCVNRRGNDLYEAGGVYLDAPLFADRYQSFAQGFAIGSRDVDYAGGVAMVIDRDGNDRYLGDIYDQGVGYWYAAGFLWDGGGNDLYEMTQYGQGSGIHLAVGGLVDVAGNDAYVMHSGLGQGGSHDFAASILHDRGGNDRYLGMTSCNGCGLTNAVGIHIDRAGDDTYAGRRDGSLNGGRPARGFASLGLLVDLAGKDDYLGIMVDGGTWRQQDIGLGVDVTAPDAGPASSGTSAPDLLSGKAEIPPVCGYEGPLTDKVFEELWGLACRWEVGDNRVIVPKARARLIAFGKDVLPRLDARMEKDEYGLELRAYVDILKAVGEQGARGDVVELLRKNLASAVDRRRRVAAYLVGEMVVKDLEGPIAAMLDEQDEGMARRAVGVLAQLSSHAGDARLLAWLASGHRAARTPDGAVGMGDEPRILAALGVLVGLESDAAPTTALGRAVENLLDHPLVSVRTRLATLLAEHGPAYAPVLAHWIAKGFAYADEGARSLRTVLDAYARSAIVPDEALAKAVAALLGHGDFGVRADAARVIRRWQGLAKADAAVVGPAVAALEHVLEAETDPYVKSAGAKR